MGYVKDLVVKHIPSGEKICASTTCDYLLVTDASNIGANALVYAIIVQLMEMRAKDK